MEAVPNIDEYSHGGDNCWTAIKNVEDQQNTIQWPKKLNHAVIDQQFMVI